MNQRSRGLWAILFGLPLLLVVPVALIGSSVMHAGTIDFQVVEKHPGGVSIGASIPAAAVPIALHFVSTECAAEIRDDLGSEGEWALEVARVALSEFAEMPDGVIVDVRTRTEVVTIEKRGGRIELMVDTPDEAVEASMPIRTIASLTRVI